MPFQRLLVAAGLALLCAPTPAASASPADLSLPVVELLSELPEADLWYGAYLNRKNVGSVHLRFERGPKKTVVGSMEGEFRLGPDVSVAVQRFVFDKTGLLVEYSERSTEEGVTTLTELVRPRKKGSWSLRSAEVPAGVEPTEADWTSKDIVHAPGVAVDFLLMGLLPRVQGQVGKDYTFRTLSSETGELRQGVAVWLGEVEEEFRGERVRVQEIRMEREEMDPEIFLVRDGRLLSVQLERAPVSFVLGTRDQAQQDLPALALTPEQAAVKGAVAVFLEGLLTNSADMAVRSSDLEAIRGRLGALHEGMDSMSPEDFEALFREGIENAQASGEGEDAMAQLALVMEALTVEATAEQAQVFLPGVPLPIFLTLKEGEWKVVWWDMFQGIAVMGQGDAPPPGDEAPAPAVEEPR